MIGEKGSIMDRFVIEISKYAHLKQNLTKKENLYEQRSVNGAGGFQVFKNKTTNHLSIGEKEGDTLH